MTPYEQGYNAVMEKLGRGMFPPIRELFRRGVKPGSGVSLMPFAKGVPSSPHTAVTRAVNVPPAALEVTAVGKRLPQRSGLTPAEILGETVVGRPPRTIAPPPLGQTQFVMPDIREIIRQRAQQAGTYARV